MTTIQLDTVVTTLQSMTFKDAMFHIYETDPVVDPDATKKERRQSQKRGQTHQY